MRAYFCVTANLQAFGSKRFHFTIELKISLSVRFGPDLLISFGSTVQNWNCDNPSDSVEKMLRYKNSDRICNWLGRETREFLDCFRLA